MTAEAVPKLTSWTTDYQYGVDISAASLVIPLRLLPINVTMPKVRPWLINEGSITVKVSFAARPP
ncbi:MAG: hypothetical protein ACI8S3_001709 [Alphaproteobacteria bacterium]|jgi:hypothetical protein